MDYFNEWTVNVHNTTDDTTPVVSSFADDAMEVQSIIPGVPWN